MQGPQDGGLTQEVQVQDMQQAAGSSDPPTMLSHPAAAGAARPTVGATITTEAPTVTGGSTGAGSDSGARGAAAAAASQARGTVDGLLAQALSMPAAGSLPGAASPGLLPGLQAALPAGALPQQAAGLNPAVLLAALQQQQAAALQQTAAAGRTTSTGSAGASAAGVPALAATMAAAGGPAFLQQLKAAGAAGNPVAQQAIDLMSRMPQNAVAQVLLGLGPNTPAKPPFNLTSALGDMSGPVSLQQAVIIQKAVRCLKDAQLANSLIALAAMVPAELQAMLNSNSINLKDVVGKLQQHLDPVRAREQFGDAYSYDIAPSQPALAAAWAAQRQLQQQAPGSEAARQAMLQQLLMGQQASAAAVAAAAGAVPGMLPGNMAAQKGAAQAKLPALLAQQMALLPAAAQQQFLQQQVALALAQAQQQGMPRGPSSMAAGARPALSGALAGAGLLGAASGAGSASLPAAGQEASSLETPQQTLARLVPGSLKHAIFEVLLAAGPQGLNVQDMMTALQAKGVGNWQDTRSAKASLTGTCSQEPAIVRIAPSRFAARVMVPGGGPAGIAASMAAADAARAAEEEQEGEDEEAGGEVAPASPHDVADDRQLVVLGQLPIQPEPGFHANDAICAVCKKGVHVAMSPLLLCDFCPCAIHVACLGLGPHLTLGLPMWAHTLPGGPADFSKLPEGQFACPRCLQRSGLKAADPPGMANLPLLGMPPRPQLPLGAAGAAARPPLSGPMTSRTLSSTAASAEGWESGTGGSKPVRFLDRAERLALAEKERQEKAARRDEKARQKEAARAAKVREREERTRAREECRNQPIPLVTIPGADPAAPAAPAPAAAAAARPPVSRVPVIKDDLDLQAEEEAELLRLQAELSHGMAGAGASRALPPTPQQLHHGQVITTSAAGPSTVALTASGSLSSVPSSGRLPSGYHHASISHAGTQPQLQQRRLIVEGPRLLERPTIVGSAAVATALEALAMAEFSCMFANLLTGITPMSCTEVQHAVMWPLHAGPRLPGLYCGLLRVLLASWQVMAAGGPLVARIKRWMRLLTRAKGDAGAWQDLLRRYLLLSRAGLSVSPSDLHPGVWADLSDDLAAVHAGVELGRVPYWKVAPELHLRCLTCLAGDVVQCEFIKDALTKRIDLAGEIQNAKLHADAEARRKGREEDKQKRQAGRGGMLAKPVLVTTGSAADLGFDAGRGRGAARGKAPVRGRGRGRGALLHGGGSMDVDGHASTPGIDEEGEGAGSEAMGTENGVAAVRASSIGSGHPGTQSQPQQLLQSPANGAGEGGKAAGTDQEQEGDAAGGASTGGLKRKRSQMGEDDEEGGEGCVDQASGWAQREEAFERDMRSVAVRTEPFGVDRHYNRYWWVPHGGPGGGLRAGSVVVESCNSDAAATLDTPQQLADLLARLNKRGAREGPLQAALLKLSDRIREGMHQRASQPHLYPNPLRPLTADAVQPTAPARLAEIAVVEDAAARVPGVNVGRGRKKAVTVASLLREASLTPQAPSPRENTPCPDDVPVRRGSEQQLTPVKSEDPVSQSQLGVKSMETEQLKQEQDGKHVAVKDEDMAAVDGQQDSAVKQEDGVKEEAKDMEQITADAEVSGQKTIVQHAANELVAMGDRLAQLGATQINTQTWGSSLRAATDAASLCTALLQCEADLCPLFDGLPDGADDAALEPLVAEVEVYAAEFVLPVEPGSEPAAPAGGTSTDKAATDGAESETVNGAGTNTGTGYSEDAEGAGVERLGMEGGEGEEDGGVGKADKPAAVSLEAGGGAARSLRGQGTGMLAVHMPGSGHAHTSGGTQAAGGTPKQAHIVLHPASQADSQGAHGQDGAPMHASTDPGMSTQQSAQQEGEQQPGPMQVDAPQQGQQPAGSVQEPEPSSQLVPSETPRQQVVAASITGDETNQDQQAPQVQLVAAIEEVDDYDPEREIDRERAFERALQQHAAQHASIVAAAAAAGEPVPEFVPLQRPFFALWRGARERCTFLRDVRRASLTGNISAAAYCVLFLADRCNMLLRRMMKEKGQLGGTDKEKAAVERAAAAAAEAERVAAERRKEEEAAVSGPRRRKLSQHASEAEAAGIRIPGAHTPAGHWATLHQSQKKGRGKARGKGRGAARGAAAVYAAQQIAEQVAAAAEQGIWLCTACGEEGELLMCEVEGCPNLMHPKCAGLDGVPEGEWYCPQHAQSLGMEPSVSLEEDESAAAGSRAKGRARGKAAPQPAARGRARGGKASKASYDEGDSGETTVSDEDVGVRAGRSAAAGTKRAAARRAVAAAVAAEAADDEKTETDSATETE